MILADHDILFIIEVVLAAPDDDESCCWLHGVSNIKAIFCMPGDADGGPYQW
jgi:hypothetical protein